jgi:glycosyltransferase involved in cell wall biosynthesis
VVCEELPIAIGTRKILAFGIIVKGSDEEASYLDNCLESIRDVSDGIFLTITNKVGEKPSKAVIDVAEKHKCEISYYEWDDVMFHFGKARKFNKEQIPKDYEFFGWCDTDDVLPKQSAQNLKKTLKKWPKNLDAIFVEYQYAFDELGNVIDTHWLPRFVRNNGSWEWADKRIHETLVEVRSSNKARSDEIKFKHMSKPDRRESSLVRNIKGMELMIDDEKENPDPRTMYYLAGAYYDAGKLDEAYELYEKYVTLSGWDEERQQAQLYMGRIKLAYGDFIKAREHYLYALAEYPSNPDPYTEIGALELENQQINKAIHWLEMGVIQKAQPNTISYNPLNRTYRPYLLLSRAHLELGGKSLEYAAKWANKALAIKNDPATKELARQTNHVWTLREQTISLVDKIKETDSDEKKLKLIEDAKLELQQNPAIIQIKQSLEKPKKWKKNSIVIYTGEATVGKWGPWSLEDGVGGSEEAIIRLTKHLKKLGYEITVYATPTDEDGVYDGIEWRNHWEINPKDEFDIFIAWRNPWVFTNKIKARKTYCWLHDVMEPEEFTEQRLANMDKIIVLSDYHRSLFPDIPDDKFLISANGIDPEEFDRTDIERIPHRIIYTSSHTRGLRHLYQIWPDVKKAVPDAELHVFYGWGSFDKINQNNPERMEWKQMMVDWAKKLDGVADHGKVSQSQIVEESFKADIWAYPTLFPEIFCITAIKCQAAGAYPVVNNFAALKETCKFGDKVEFEEWSEEVQKEYTELLIATLENTNKSRTEMMKWARENWSWEKVAEQWHQNFSE